MTTHTFATLDISAAAFDEIAAKLRAAGYDHAFTPDGEIDMHGIGLVKESSLKESLLSGKRVAMLESAPATKGGRAALRRVDLSALEGKVTTDRENGIIRNVAIMGQGDTGYGFSLDETSQKQAMALINADPNGMKVHLKHPQVTRDGDGNPVELQDQLGQMVGRLKSCKLDGAMLRADVYLGSYAKSLPALGNVRDFLMDVADNDPGAIGMSAVFNWDPEVKLDDAGKPVAVLARITQMHQVDFVGQGAVTPNGLLEATEVPAALMPAAMPSAPTAASLQAAFMAVTEAATAAKNEIRKLLDAGALADVGAVVAACGIAGEAAQRTTLAARACIDLVNITPPGSVVDEAMSESASACARQLPLLQDECADGIEFLQYRVYGSSDLSKAAAMCVPLLRTCRSTTDDCAPCCWSMSFAVAELTAKQMTLTEAQTLAGAAVQIEAARLTRKLKQPTNA